jgi:hypothetical protein
LYPKYIILKTVCQEGNEISLGDYFRYIFGGMRQYIGKPCPLAVFLEGLLLRGLCSCGGFNLNEVEFILIKTGQVRETPKGVRVKAERPAALNAHSFGLAGISTYGPQVFKDVQL